MPKGKSPKTELPEYTHQLYQSPCALSAVGNSVPVVRLKLSSHTMNKLHLFLCWQSPGYALPGRVSIAGWGKGKGRQLHKKGQHYIWWERQSLVSATCSPWQASKTAHRADTETVMVWSLAFKINLCRLQVIIKCQGIKIKVQELLSLYRRIWQTAGGSQWPKQQKSKLANSNLSEKPFLEVN